MASGYIYLDKMIKITIQEPFFFCKMNITLKIMPAVKLYMAIQYQ